MVAIAINALLMFGLGVDMWLRLQAKGFRRVPEKIWRLWIEHPRHREGKIGRLLDTVTGAGSLAASAAIFQGIRTAEIAPFTRDLRVMKVCVAAGPLLGLFGTVTGMLATFGALASGSGGEKTMSAVAKGISEALITTETGLVVALPGLFFQYQLTRQKERYSAFLAHLETVCTQFLYRRLRARHTAA
ncbi:MAG: MotA/TolQ/ExbB proton channel family protein [Planctomycetes bacterium]|nr:MotA/TolQ/ExbB proton channel family protein [Planctomycetota bacterium]